jgi:hypothetical protein
MAIKKKVTEKATGEKYASKSAKAKHEKKESKAEMKKEYGYVKSPAKMGSSEAISKARSTQVNADKKRKTNEATKSYNDAKATLRSTDKKLDQPGGRYGTARQAAARRVSSMEASDPKTYKSIKGLPAPGAKATTKPATKPAEKPKANSYETANKGGAMDKLVKARNSAAKGSREYAAAQNQINAAMGSKVRHAAKKIESVSVLKPVEVKKAEITVSTPAKMKKKC